VAAFEIAEQTNREIPDPRSDIEHTVLRAKAATQELLSGACTCPFESRPSQSTVVVHAQVSRREQGVMAGRHSLEVRQGARERGPLALSPQATNCQTGCQESDLPRRLPAVVAATWILSVMFPSMSRFG
jgi:hypothetical protein